MDEKFRNFLYDPTMPKAKKIAGITEFCDGAGFDKITKSFLCVTAENGRLKETSKILGCLEEYSLKAAGQVKATVTSAFPLNEDQLTRLTGLIKKKLDDPEDELTVETKVDSKLVGGFTVAMGGGFLRSLAHDAAAAHGERAREAASLILIDSTGARARRTDAV